MNKLSETLASLGFGTARSAHNLTLVPLLRPAAGPADYLTLDVALAEGLVEVTEISEGGSVPTLRLHNRGERKVLLVDGEELVGARLGLPAYTGKMTPPESTPGLRQVLAQVEDAKFKYESASKLVKSGDVSQERFTELEKAYRARQAGVELARDEMRVSWMGVTALEADLKIFQKRRGDTILRAPFDGEIGEKLAAVGQFVKDNTPLLRLVKTNPLRLRAEIPEAAAGTVKIGTQLVFTTDAVPGATFTAVVRQLNPSLDSRSRTLSAEARLVQADARLRPGMFVQVRLVTQAAARMVAVPRQSIYSVAGLTKLFVIQNGVAKLVTFTPGAEIDGWVEVPNDVVQKGDQVAMTQLGMLTNGTKVRK